MKRFDTIRFAAALALGFSLISASNGLAAMPLGRVTCAVNDSANVLWDLATMEAWRDIDFEIGKVQSRVRYDVDFAQNGQGKLTGTGLTMIRVDSPLFYGVYSNAVTKVTGSISRSARVAKVSFTATAKARVNVLNRGTSATMSAVRTMTIDTSTRQVTGKYSNRASVSPGGKGNENGSLPLSWEDVQRTLGDGAWTLTLDLAQSDATTLQGSATVQLRSGAQYDFSVKGRYISTSDTTQLTLTAEPSAKGSDLTVSLKGSSVTRIAGEVSGQAINYQAP